MARAPSMADNKFYIASGIIPNDTGESESSNQFFIASGMVPDDKSGAPTGAIMKQLQKANMGADLYNGAIIA